MKKIKVNKEGERLILKGFKTIYSKKIESCNAKDGDWVYIYGPSGFLGCGFFRERTMSIRIVSYEKTDPETALIENLEKAIELRKKINCYKVGRLCFGEVDLLPGLIIDKYNDIIVFKNNCTGWENYKDLLVDYLQNHGKTIYEKSTGRNRIKEGLPEIEKIHVGDKTITEVKEGRIKFKVDVKKGQKTGLFLDQKLNRLFCENINAESVLDCFCYNGGFGLHIKADYKVFVDSSKTSCKFTKENLSLNSQQGVVINMDAFQYLKKCVEQKTKFDCIILDPPAFIQSPGDKEEGLKGYAKINRLAIKLIKEGFLITCSCSYFLSEEEFLSLVINQIKKEKKRFKILHIGCQSPDHPFDPFSETKYLKCFVFQIY